MTRAPKLITSIASAALVLVFATACGGDDDGRPSADEISSAMEDNADEFFAGSDSIPEDAIDWDCFGKAYHDSDISDETLRALVDQDEDYKPSEDDQKELIDVSSSATDCVDIEMPDLGESPSS